MVRHLDRLIVIAIVMVVTNARRMKGNRFCDEKMSVDGTEWIRMDESDRFQKWKVFLSTL